jgi:hypothetical protein
MRTEDGGGGAKMAPPYVQGTPMGLRNVLRCRTTPLRRRGRGEMVARAVDNAGGVGEAKGVVERNGVPRSGKRRRLR